MSYYIVKVRESVNGRWLTTETEKLNEQDTLNFIERFENDNSIEFHVMFVQELSVDELYSRHNALTWLGEYDEL